MSRRRDQDAPPVLFLVDKPEGATSHDVVQMIRRWTGVRRVGHGGTLDPLATGLLPVFVGGATRMVEYLVEHRKSYTATLRLGQATDTDDSEGQVILEGPVPELSLADLSEALSPFRGEVEQVPPVYSAVKVGGVVAHRAARRGEPVDRPPRTVNVYELEAEVWEAPFLQIRMTVGSGTYVRAIARDLGEALGCGAHVVEMRRTAIGPISADNAHTPDQLEAAADAGQILDLAISPRAFFEHWPRVVASEDQRRTLLHGQAIWAASHPDERFMLALGKDGELIAVLSPGPEAAGRWQPVKVLARQRK
ncbi:MAG TPA: tRNA pseudouridine(55) synthase TruB [Dehalococcoidia bacterium]|nr:tRNA pseudouridine(55) synthase TruB [Dehalococcoidia bacterium]